MNQPQLFIPVTLLKRRGDRLSPARIAAMIIGLWLGEPFLGAAFGEQCGTPDCPICLLGVCQKGGSQPATGSQKPRDPAQRPRPLPNDPNPLVNIENQLNNLQPSDTSSPVTEWAGMSERDFTLAVLSDFVMSGYCQDVKQLPLNIAYAKRQRERPKITTEEQDRWRKEETDLKNQLQKAQSSIKQQNYDCSSSWERWDERHPAQK